MKQFLLVLLLLWSLTQQSFSQVISIPISFGSGRPSVSSFAVDSGRLITIKLKHGTSSSSQSVNTALTFAEITLYNPALQVIGQSSCSISMQSRPVKVLVDSEGYGILFYSDTQADIHMLTIHRNGTVANLMRMPVHYRFGDITLFSNPQEKGFYLVHPKKKKVSQIQKFDLNGHLFWTTELQTARLGTIASFMSGIENNILRFDYSPKDGIGRNLVQMNAIDGSIVSNTPFYQKAAKTEKENILTNVVVKDSLIYQMGVYFEKGSKKHKHDGLFLTATNIKGDKLFTHYYAADSQIASLLPKETMREEARKILPRFLIPTQQGLILCAETVDKVPKGNFAIGLASGIALGMIGIPLAIIPQGAAYKVQDMLFFSFNVGGQLEKITRVDKYTSFKTTPIPINEVAINLLDAFSVFDASSYHKDDTRSMYHVLLKENPAKNQGTPRIGCISMDQQATSFQLKTRMLTDLIVEEKKIRSIDWLMLPNGDVLLQYLSKDNLHLSKIPLEEFQ
ncbi:hypothetical protein [Xanthocytophaga agilis]|uniref:Uncharacterized protein n=1 Tax=Xanthocytophaga agilis TaxID=3048010 RepID=A0AAE3UKA5_9BACT|nr:hypothetical protein [Xanthocytophaga agilis]MDJ1506823.1 hypothetical protein [Xanthocytophaga agilis]